MKNFFFEILGIEPTKDEKKIKKAYHFRLHSVNPEEDEQGFRQLREAYEEALKYAKQKELPGKEQSPAEQFIMECKEVYDTFAKRIQIVCWERLFQEDVCFCLETEAEVRKAFFLFLMEHFQLPENVWKLIDRQFHISGHRKELIEFFPEAYVDFLLQAVRYNGALNYALFDGTPNENYDAFIENYHRLRQFVDMGMIEDAKKELVSIEKYGIYHPYVDLEKARLLLFDGEEEAAGKQLEKLTDRYHTEERIVYTCGQYLQSKGKWEKAGALYEQLLQGNPDAIWIKSGKAEVLLHQGYYRQARELTLELLENNPQEERYMNNLSAANVFLIEELREKYDKGMLCQDEIMELAWCYYQNMLFDEGLSILHALTPDEDHILDYHNLSGRIYLTINKNQKALIHLILWLSELKKVTPDGTKKTEKKLARYGYAYYTIGSAKASIALEENGDLSEAMWYFEQAVEKEKDLAQIVSYYHTMADLWRQKKEYEKVCDLCDKIVDLDPQYYPAFLIRQEASLALGRYQGVVDDYQRAVSLYPYYGKPYSTMIKMYFLFHEYQKAEEILETARKNKVESDELMLLTSRLLVMNAENVDDLKKALLLLNQLEEKGWSLQSDIEKEDWTEIAYRRGLLFMDFKNMTEAMKCFMDVLEIEKDNVAALYSYATVLLQTGQYFDALEPMKRVLKMNPKHPGVRHILTEIYERIARKQENNSYYERALPYMKEQLARYPESYYYIEMGLLYLDMDAYPEALAQFEQAFALDAQSVYAYNNAGNCYLAMEQPKKAIPFFQKAISVMKDEMTPLPYTNLAKAYQMAGEYLSAKESYEEAIVKYPNFSEGYLLFGEFLREYEEYAQAIENYNKGILFSENTKALELEKLLTYGEAGAYDRAAEYQKKLEKKYKEESSLHQIMGEIALYGKGNYKEAEGYFQKAIADAQKERNPKRLRSSYYLYARCLLLLKKEEESRKAFAKYFTACRDENESLETYEDFYGESFRRKFRMGMAYWFLGEKERAKLYFAKFSQRKYRCDDCVKRECFEARIAQAFLYCMDGQYKKALLIYEKARKVVPNDLEHRFEFWQIKKLEEQK